MIDKLLFEDKKQKYYCEGCGKEITEEEFEDFDGFCEECYWMEEDELTEEEGII